MDPSERPEAQVEEALREEQERWRRIAEAKSPEELERALRDPPRPATETRRAARPAAGRASRKLPPPRPPAPRTRWWEIVFTLVVVLAVVAAANHAIAPWSEDTPGVTTTGATSSERVTGAPPRSNAFSSARAYASAMTLYGLRSAREVEGRPACGARVTWTEWACVIWATASRGPYAGMRLAFRCRASEGRRVGDLVTGSLVVCGPTNAPRLGRGARPRARERFGSARSYAAAMTLYMLRDSNDIEGRPRCGARATWTEWACTVRGRPKQGPYAGRPLTFRCRSGAVGSTGGPAAAGTHCAPTNLPGSLEDTGPPRPERFATARGYASAMTLYVLRPSTDLEGRPDCGARVSWTRWACTVRATPTRGAYAGIALTYRCRVTTSERIGRRAIARGSECGPTDQPIVP